MEKGFFFVNESEKYWKKVNSANAAVDSLEDYIIENGWDDESNDKTIKDYLKTCYENNTSFRSNFRKLYNKDFKDKNLNLKQFKKDILASNVKSGIIPKLKLALQHAELVQENRKKPADNLNVDLNRQPGELEVYYLRQLQKNKEIIQTYGYLQETPRILVTLTKQGLINNHESIEAVFKKKVGRPLLVYGKYIQAFTSKFLDLNLPTKNKLESLIKDHENTHDYDTDMTTLGSNNAPIIASNLVFHWYNYPYIYKKVSKQFLSIKSKTDVENFIQTILNLYGFRHRKNDFR